jgi:hypothetical protein
MKKIRKRSTAIAEIINRIARPEEYAHRSNEPIAKDVLEAASVRIPDSIGPMQGVHPAPRVMPTIRGSACLDF